MAAFDEAILAPALKMRRLLNERKTEEVAEVDLDVFLRSTPKGRPVTKSPSSGRKGGITNKD